MASQKGMACIAALALLAFVCHAAMGSDENDNRTTTHAITVNAASLPDFDGDGTVGFSDFVIFAQNFGKEVPSPVVAIPDANLWVAIEDALGKANGVPITQAEMATLDRLWAVRRYISDGQTSSCRPFPIGHSTAPTASLADLTSPRCKLQHALQITTFSFPPYNFPYKYIHKQS